MPSEPEPATPAAAPMSPQISEERPEAGSEEEPENGPTESHEAAVQPQPAAWNWERIEQVVGRQWMTWLGVVVLFVAGGFFAHYAIQNGFLGPWARLACGLVIAVGCAVAGEIAYRKTFTIFGHGLFALATMLAYVALYASFSPLNGEILASGPTFLGMVAVTAVAIALAVRRHAMAVAVLATLGGFATPVLVSNEQGSLVQLGLYVLVLNSGVLAAAWYRSWRGLDALAWAGTVVVFGLGWYTAGGSPWSLTVFIMAFWAIFTAVPLARSRRRQAYTICAGWRSCRGLGNRLSEPAQRFHQSASATHAAGKLSAGAFASYLGHHVAGRRLA